MEYILLLVLGFIGGYFLAKKILTAYFEKDNKRDIDDKVKEYYEEQKKQADIELKQEYSAAAHQYTEKIHLYQSQLDQIMSQYGQIQQQEQTARENIDANIKEYEIKEREKIQRLLTEEEKRLKENLDLVLKEYSANCETKKLELEADLLIVQSTLDDFKLRQAAINAEVLRRKQIEEEEDFFKIGVSKNDQEDIQVLQPIRSQLHNREAFDKLIYDVFIKRPADEMIKRVLGGEAPAGIYKITYLPTGEFYIGRSTNIKTRWQDHVKTACGLKGCAHSTLHTMMEKYGIWNFSFEVIEACDKDQLNEKEKFYIDLYGADGLINMKAGG